MGKRFIRKMEDLTRNHSEGPENWKTRKIVARSVLAFMAENRPCRIKFAQELTVETNEGLRRPDFFVTCDAGHEIALELGRTGFARIEELEGAGMIVFRVARLQPFNFERRMCDICADCGR